MPPQPQPASPFRAGSLVIAKLANPREKFWGAILHLSSVGVSLRGVDVSSFDDFISQIRDGEPFTAGVMFFPMHRVERLELDLPEGTIPSLAQRFAEKTGQDPAPILVSEFLPTDDGVGRTLLSANDDTENSAADAFGSQGAPPRNSASKSPSGDDPR